MRVLKGVFLAAVATVVAANGQPATTNVQPISLQEVIQRALEHNLELQIERYNPLFTQYDLNLAYAGYDPVFSASAEHAYRKTGGGLDAERRTIPPRTEESDSVDARLDGLTPWGMNYSLQAATTDSFGETSFFQNVTNGAPVLVSSPFENANAVALLRLQQPLLRNLWIDNTRLNIAVAKNRLRFSELGLKQQIIEIVTSAEKAYYDLIFAQENVKVQEEALRLADRLFEENRKRVEVGVLAPLDEKQAASQVAARQADLLSARLAVTIQQNLLKRLISDDYGPFQAVYLAPTEKLTATPHFFNLHDSWAKGLTLRPDLMQAKLDVERSGIQLRYYRNQIFPQLDVFGTYGHSGVSSEFSGAIDGIGQGDRPFHGYGVVFSIPLSNKSARNRYRAGKAVAEQTVLLLKSREQTIMTQIDNALGEAQASYKRVAATRQAREYAEAALEAEQKKLESGKSTSFVVLQLQRDLTAARSQEIRALADYNKALAEIARQEGTTLERNNVDIDEK